MLPGAALPALLSEIHSVWWMLRTLKGGDANAGSPILSRDGWRALLAEQGFSNVLVAGQNAAAPALLSRQSVVIGVSDGAIRIARQKVKQAGARRTAAAKPSPAASHKMPVQASLAPPATAAVVQV